MTVPQPTLVAYDPTRQLHSQLASNGQPTGFEFMCPAGQLCVSVKPDGGGTFEVLVSNDDGCLSPRDTDAFIGAAGVIERVARDVDHIVDGPWVGVSARVLQQVLIGVHMTCAED